MKEIKFSQWLFELNTCKITQPIQPIWQHILPCLSLPSKSHCEKSISSICLESPFFWIFKYSRNSQCIVISTVEDPYFKNKVPKYQKGTKFTKVLFNIIGGILSRILHLIELTCISLFEVVFVFGCIILINANAALYFANHMPQSKRR